MAQYNAILFGRRGRTVLSFIYDGVPSRDLVILVGKGSIPVDSLIMVEAEIVSGSKVNFKRLSPIHTLMENGDSTTVSSLLHRRVLNKFITHLLQHV